MYALNDFVCRPLLLKHKDVCSVYKSAPVVQSRKGHMERSASLYSCTAPQIIYLKILNKFYDIIVFHLLHLNILITDTGEEIYSIHNFYLYMHLCIPSFWEILIGVVLLLELPNSKILILKNDMMQLSNCFSFLSCDINRIEFC